MVRETASAARRHVEEAVLRLKSERTGLERQMRNDDGEVRRLVASGTTREADLARLADLQERMRGVEQRLTGINQEIATLTGEVIDEREVAKALAAFDPLWESLAPREQARLIALLVERVDYDGKQGTVSLTFHPTGIRALVERAAADEEDAA